MSEYSKYNIEQKQTDTEEYIYIILFTLSSKQIILDYSVKHQNVYFLKKGSNY